MTKNSAKQIVLLSVQSSSSLSRVLEFAKKNCPDDEYVELHKSVAEISGTIFQLLVQPLLHKYPELEGEIDSEVI